MRVVKDGRGKGSEWSEWSRSGALNEARDPHSRVMEVEVILSFRSQKVMECCQSSGECSRCNWDRQKDDNLKSCLQGGN